MYYWLVNIEIKPEELALLRPEELRINMKKDFPRFFISDAWTNITVFLKIDNETDYGYYYYVSGNNYKSEVYNLRACLKNKNMREIPRKEAVLLL